MEEKTLSQETVFEGRIYNVERHVIQCVDGQESIRDIVRHNGAVGVMARKPNGAFIMVKQYRKAVEESTLEIVAGTLELGEEPEPCAFRELKEESGYSTEKLTKLGIIYPSPGIISERIHLFFAEVGEEASALDLDEDEHVEVYEFMPEEINRMIAEGELRDTKTISAWQLYQLKIESTNA